MTYLPLLSALKGGPGSGNWGHAGRTGKRGGSMPQSGLGAAMSLRSGASAQFRKAMAKPIKVAGATDFAAESKQLTQYGAGLSEEPSKAYGLEGAEGWMSDVRGEVKNEICTKLSQATGLSYDAVNDAIRQWADTSNDNDYRSLSMQEAATRVFGNQLSDWQKGKIAKVLDPTYSNTNKIPAFDNNHSPYKSPEAAQEAFLKAMHTQTQEWFAQQGIKTVTLYRGTGTDFKSRGLKPGDQVSMQSNAMESWTIHPSIAKGFSNSILKVEVPVSRIVGTARTGYGCLNEYEYIVLGGGTDDTATVFNTASF